MTTTKKRIKTLEIIPSERIDYCVDCDKDHGYNCPLEDKFLKNPVAKKIKADNLERKLQTEESEKLVRDSIAYAKGYNQSVDENWWKFACVFGIIGFALGIIFFHVFLIIPLIN